jgi:hypothetical protein
MTVRTTIAWHAAGNLLGAESLGIVTFFLLGVAVTTLVPKPDTALPVAYGTMLPLAFISDVFFSSAHAPQWLHDLASALPVAPIARAMEAAFHHPRLADAQRRTDHGSGMGWRCAAVHDAGVPVGTGPAAPVPPSFPPGWLISAAGDFRP